MRGYYFFHIFKLAGISVFAETPQFLGKMKNITAYEGTEKVIFTCVLKDTGDQQMVGISFIQTILSNDYEFKIGTLSD